MNKASEFVDTGVVVPTLGEPAQEPSGETGSIHVDHFALFAIDELNMSDARESWVCRRMFRRHDVIVRFRVQAPLLAVQVKRLTVPHMPLTRLSLMVLQTCIDAYLHGPL